MIQATLKHYNYCFPEALPVIIYKQFINAAIYLLWFSAAFDPVGQLYGIRYIALGLIAFIVTTHVLASGKFPRIKHPHSYFLFIFSLFIPLFGYTISVARGGLNGEFIDTSYFASATYFLCSIIYIIDHRLLRVGLQAQLFILRLLCGAIIFCLIVTLADLPSDWIYFFVGHGITFFGERDYGGIVFNYIYFIASPMLIFLLVREAWECSKKPSLLNIVALSLPVSALFLTGTRANMAASFLGVAFTVVWQRFGRKPALAIVLALPILFILMLMSDVDFINDMLSTTESSNSTKIEYLRSYAEIFSDPATLLVGQGFNAQTWSLSLLKILGFGASKTELTYLELIRVLGLPVGAIIIGSLIYIFLSHRTTQSEFPWVAPATLLYLVISSLNPYLFSSNGMLLLGFAAVVMTTKHLILQPNLRENSHV